MKRNLTLVDIKAVGLKAYELARVLGVHPTTISDMLRGVTKTPTPGALAIVWLWPLLTDAQRQALLAGEHLGSQEAASLADKAIVKRRQAAARSLAECVSKLDADPAAAPVYGAFVAGEIDEKEMLRLLAHLRA